MSYAFTSCSASVVYSPFAFCGHHPGDGRILSYQYERPKLLNYIRNIMIPVAHSFKNGVHPNAGVIE